MVVVKTSEYQKEKSMIPYPFFLIPYHLPTDIMGRELADESRGSICSLPMGPGAYQFS